VIVKNPNRLPGDAEQTTAETPKMDQPVVQEGPSANPAGSRTPWPGRMTRIGSNAGQRMLIRAASTSDAEAITEVHIAAILEAYCDLLPADELARIAADARYRADLWRYHLAEGSSTTLIAEVDGDFAGFVDFEACEEAETPETVGEITAIFVQPEDWSLGIGEALMREAMARLRDGGWVGVVLWVIRRNLRAVDFFERLGFRMDGAVRIRKMYGNRADGVRLRRLLEESE
jgi:ribosomal protein S18 acetylase RimI-like enzyme